MRTPWILSIVAASTLTLGPVRPTFGACGSHRLVDDLAALERRSGIEASKIAVATDLRARIDALAAKMSETALQGDPWARVTALNRLIFSEVGILASQDLKNPDNLLPSRVLDRKQGYCVGIAALYLALSERLDLPLHAVATPSHVFLRFDDGTTRINIETLQGGASIPDEQYAREQKIPEESIRRGIFMRNLTTEEFLAQVHNNLGVIYSERKDYEKAAAEYERALDLDARLPATLYNWANDLLRQGEYRQAVRRFSKALRLYPTDVWALNNRGLAYGKLGRREKARRDFEDALRLDPGFKQAQRNLGELQSPP
jgi:regulator of sirC expression with transglutaminase-like and TPR domain